MTSGYVTRLISSYRLPSPAEMDTYATSGPIARLVNSFNAPPFLDPNLPSFRSPYTKIPTNQVPIVVDDCYVVSHPHSSPIMSLLPQAHASLNDLKRAGLEILAHSEIL